MLVRIAALVVSCFWLVCGTQANASPRCKPPGWTQRPTSRDMYQAYPPEALKQKIEGDVLLRCTTQPDGSLADCAVDSETPAGHGFGPAALMLIQKFRGNIPCPGAAETQPQGARVPIRFKLHY